MLGPRVHPHNSHAAIRVERLRRVQRGSPDLQPKRRQLERPPPPAAYERQLRERVALDFAIFAEVERHARPPTGSLPLRERRLDPAGLAPRVADVASDDGRQRATRAEADEHAQELRTGKRGRHGMCVLQDTCGPTRLGRVTP